MADFYAAALAWSLINEGGARFTNAPLDHGGPTKYGITLATLSAYRGAACTAAVVQELGQGTASAIYRSRYWQPMGLDAAPSQAVATAAFDGAVLCGVRAAARALQAALGVETDGIIGPVTRAAMTQCDTVATVTLYQTNLTAYLNAIVQHDPSQRIWLAGWLSRVAKLQSLVLATSTV